MVPIAVIPGALIAGAGSKFGLGIKFWWSALEWGLSDALGIVLCAPPLFAWTCPSPKIKGSKREAFILFASLCLFSSIVIFYPGLKVIERSLFSFLVFFAAWAAIRFGSRGATLALVVIDMVEIYATGHGIGTFANIDLLPSERLLSVQILVANVAMLVLVLAAALEEQTDLREGAETATRIRDDFISVASHELKTPLTSLKMEIQILNNYITTGKIKTVPDERLHKLARISDQEIKRFSSLINDLLDVSRITSGRISFNREEVDTLVVVNEAVERLQSEITRSGSIVSVSGQKDLRGLWDKVRIDQVVTNLLSNAIKYGCGRPVMIKVQEERGSAIIEVRDQGLGIPEEDQDRIFHRFERAVTAKEYSGLGLGLFIARQIVEAHGGRITVRSEPGHGSSFRVELPLMVTEGRAHPYWRPHGEFEGQIYH
jgi:signal transduction histidine kinase